MNSVQDHRKHQLLFILLMSFLLVLTFPGLAKAETETASTGAANAVTVSSQTTSPAPATSEATGPAKASTEAASVASDGSNSGKATSSLSPSGEGNPSLPQAEKPQANQTPASEKPAVTEVSTEKAQAGDASQAEKDAKEKAAAGAPDKEKTPSGDASQAEKEAKEKDTASIADKEKASTDDPAQAEEENPEAIDPTQVDAGLTENEDPSQLKNETAEAPSPVKEAEVLEKGETLEVESLAKAPMALGAGAGNGQKTFEVDSFEALQKAIENAGNEPTTIIITKSFTLKETLTIGSGQNITITSGADRSKDNNKVTPIGEDKIDQPKGSDSVKRRQELVEEAKGNGEKALEETDLEKHPLPEVGVVIQRATDFLGTLFKVEKDGKLTLGKDNRDPLFIDGNKDVKTKIENGSIIDVSGDFTMNGGFIAHSNNEHVNSAPVYVHKNATFTMNGGRITSNKNISKGDSTFNAAGAVYIDEGGKFTLESGSIDNNHAPVGGVFLGKIFGNKNGKRIPALFTMNGGYIARNIGPMFSDANSDIQYYGGGVHVDSLANFTFNDGIIAGNASYHGGGVAINDNYIKEFSFKEYSITHPDEYEDYIKYAGAGYTQNGGLIYKNTAKLKDNNILTGAGGGLYINSSKTAFKDGYILNNKSDHEGGGIYLSLYPVKLTLEHTLITKNRAVNDHKTMNQLRPGEGGGYWNCPEGDDIIQDYHSLYIFENEALYNGADIHTGYKSSNFKLNGKDKKFTTRISPITEQGNIIKYLDDINKKDPEWMYYTNEALNLKAHYDAATIEEAWTNSNVFIIGNESDRGGGIGSNADIFSPGHPKDNKIIIEKKWDKSVPEDKIPDSIWVDLYIGDKKYAEVELGEKNNWTYKFENLPFTSEELAKLKFNLKERTDDFYSVIEEGDKTSLEVERIWANYSNTYDPKPTNINHSEKIIFIFKDKNGQELSRKDVKISNLEGDGKKWTGLLNNDLFAGLKNLDNVTITYHDFYTQYNWPGYYGLDGSSDWDGSGPWHKAYVIEKADGRIEIQLPYIWTQYLNGVDRTQDYSKNKSGYRLALVPSHRFTITNYPYSEIPVEKHWDKSIQEKDIPDSVNVYLLKDGKRFVDENGKDRVVTLSKENGWKGSFEKLPYFELEGMGFDHYWVKEDSEIFIPLVKAKEKPMINIVVERVQELDKYGYKIDDEDYAGGVYRIEYIPFEVHHGSKVEQFKITFHPTNPYIKIWGDLTGETNFLADIELTGKPDIEIKTYYDKDGNPFPRNLGSYLIRESEPPVNNPGAYILKLVEENGKLVLYVPKLTSTDWGENLLNVKARIIGKHPYFELTNHYLPKHRIEIEKIWDVINSSSILKNLKVKVEGKYVNKEVTLSPEEWKYVEEFLGKGLLATNKYAFTEEELANFNGTQSIETSLEFTAKDKTVTFLNQDGKAISQEDFLKLVQGKDYSFELKEAAADKAEVEIKYDAEGKLVIVYPVDVTITEVAKVLFKNTENPPERPPSSNTRIIRVTKAWDLAGHENPVSEIIVELYRDGEATGKQLTLNAANNWTGSFTGLEIASKANPAQKYQYTIREVGDANGLFEADGKKFEVSYTGDMFTGFTITNKEIPEKPPQPPETPEEPPVTPPETPEEPPVTPPQPPVVPQTPPTVPEAPGKAPQTGLPANGDLFLLMAMGLVGLRLTRRRKRTDGQ